MMIRLLSVLVLVAVTASANSGWAATVHPYHVSLCEIEWNSDSKSFEVALCVWPADLEKALARELDRPVDLDTERDLDEKIAALIRKRFQVAPAKSPATDSAVANSSTKPNSTVQPIRWVGQEIELKQAWLYFEVREIEPGQIWQLRNQIFHELNEDQINQINARIGKHYQRASLTLNQPAMAIEIKPANQPATGSERRHE